MSKRELKEAPLTYADADRIFHEADGKYLLLLLTECSVPKKIRPGIQELALSVSERITATDGPLDCALKAWAEDRPSKVKYHRMPLDRADSRTMARVGVCWLPQVRVVRKETILFRSSVSIGDNKEFLAQDVGGMSFIRRVDPSSAGLVNLLDALSAEVDRRSIKI